MSDLVKNEIATNVAEIAKATFEQARNGEIKEGINVVPTLYEFTTIGDKLIGFFVGFKNISLVDDKTAEIKEIPAVHWISEINGSQTLIANMGKMVVDTFRDVSPQTLFSIELTKIESLKGGKTFKHYAIKFFS